VESRQSASLAGYTQGLVPGSVVAVESKLSAVGLVHPKMTSGGGGEGEETDGRLARSTTDEGSEVMNDAPELPGKGRCAVRWSLRSSGQ
jgi:hypothetical protein